MTPDQLRPRDVVAIGPRAGLQYRLRGEPLLFRIATIEQPTHSPDGTFWLTGAEISIHRREVPDGYREIWIQDHCGVSLVDRPQSASTRRQAARRNAAPARRHSHVEGGVR